MKFNRDHYLMISMVLLLFGIQLRLVDTYVLNEKTTTFIAEKMAKREVASNTMITLASLTPGAIQSEERRKLQPQRWIGWSLVSVGGVCVLHSLILRKPE